MDPGNAVFVANLYVGILTPETQFVVDAVHEAPGGGPYASLVLEGITVHGPVSGPAIMTRAAMARLAGHALAWRDRLPTETRDQFDAEMADERSTWLKGMRGAL